MRALLFLLVVTSVLTQVFQQSRETFIPSKVTAPVMEPLNCPISVVGAGFSGLYTTWRLANSNVDPKTICLFESLDRVGGRILTVGSEQVPELGNKVIEGGFYRYHNVRNYIMKTLVEDVFKIPVECYFTDVEKLEGTQETLWKEDFLRRKTLIGNDISSVKWPKCDAKTGELISEKGVKRPTEQGVSDFDILSGKNVKKPVQQEGMIESDLLMGKGVKKEKFIGAQKLATPEIKDKCKVKNKFALFRNILLSDKDFDSSDLLPFLLRKNEMWNNVNWKRNLNRLFKTIVSEATNGIVNDNVLRSLKTNDINTFITRARPLLLTLLNATYKGVPLMHLSVNSLLVDKFNPSSEFFALINNLFGSIDSDAIFSSNMLNFICHYIHMCSLDRSGMYVHIKQGDGRKGFSTLTNLMLADIRNKGVKIFMKHTLFNIVSPTTRDVSDIDINSATTSITLKFENNVNVITNRLFLTIGAHQLKSISSDSVLFKSADPNFLKYLASLHELGSHKIYLLYENAFWKNLTTSRLKTSAWIKEIRYFDSPFVIPTQSPVAASVRSSGFLQLSYIFGDPHWQPDSLTLDKSTVLNIIKPDTTRNQLVLNLLHKKVIDIHKDIVDTKNIDLPKLALVFNWHTDHKFRAGVIPQIVNVANVIDLFRAIVFPVPGLNIHLVNPDLAGEIGWETGFDGAAMMAEFIFKNQLGMSKPTWMSDVVYSTLTVPRLDTFREGTSSMPIKDTIPKETLRKEASPLIKETKQKILE